ncbi:MAG: hypothetical protein KDM64_13720 [Verrucomicrobiae bacterium]|nr:hypothetical protein [Verrucomicrobiae bacterium]
MPLLGAILVVGILFFGFDFAGVKSFPGMVTLLAIGIFQLFVGAGKLRRMRRLHTDIKIALGPDGKVYRTLKKRAILLRYLGVGMAFVGVAVWLSIWSR